MNDNTSQSKCRKCQKPIFWHRSRTGKPYPTDSATDRRAFHQCDGAAQQPTTQQAKVEKPAPDFEPTLEERLIDLETQVARLNRTVIEIQKRQPIDSSDVGF